MRIQLFDTNLDDGIDPSVTFYHGGFNRTYGYINTIQTGPGGGSGGGSLYGNDIFDPIDLSSDFPLGISAQAKVTGTGEAEGTTMHAEGSAQGTPDRRVAQVYSGGAYVGGYSINFAISPNTILLVSAIANLNAETTLGTVAGDSQSEHASAQVRLNMYGPGAAGQDGQTSSDSRTIDVSYVTEEVYDPLLGASTTVYRGQSQSISGILLGVTFTNLTQGPLEGAVSLYANVSGSTSVAGVPEPEQFALLGAGLLVLGQKLRRHGGMRKTHRAETP